MIPESSRVFQNSWLLNSKIELGAKIIQPARINIRPKKNLPPSFSTKSVMVVVLPDSFALLRGDTAAGLHLKISTRS